MELWSEDRDPKRIKRILEKIEVLWGNSHDLRFNQDKRMMRYSKRNIKIVKHTKFINLLLELPKDLYTNLPHK